MDHIVGITVIQILQDSLLPALESLILIDANVVIENKMMMGLYDAQGNVLDLQASLCVVLADVQDD